MAELVGFKQLRQRDEEILFSPQPVVRHRDRETMAAFLNHQMRWAIHSYAVRFGYERPRRLRRAVMLPTFLLLLPLFALYTSYLNMAPWVAKDWRYIAYWPAVFTVLGLKGVGVLAGILNPGMALYGAEHAAGIGDT